MAGIEGFSGQGKLSETLRICCDVGGLEGGMCFAMSFFASVEGLPIGDWGA